MTLSVFSANDLEFSAETKEGGMAKVQKATIKKTGEVVAVKSAKHPGASDAAVSFDREIKALSDMDHPNVVKLKGIGSSAIERFLVLEWLEETLATRIESVGQLTWQNFYELIGRPVLDGIRHAHSRAYTHRDIKPWNVMFDRLGAPKITDFGIARSHDHLRQGVTFAHANSGPWTPAEIDNTTSGEGRDLYSWAALCIACVTGRLDFGSAAELRATTNQLGKVVPVILLLRCLDDDPAKRPDSATETLWELDDFHRERLNESEAARWIGLDISPLAHSKLTELCPEGLSADERVAKLLSDFGKPGMVYGLPEGDFEFTGDTFCFRASRTAPDAPWIVVKDVWPASARPISALGIKIFVNFAERQRGLVEANTSRANLAFVESYLAEQRHRAIEEQRRKDEERYLTLLQDVVGARMRALRDMPALAYVDGKWVGDLFSVALEGEDVAELGETRVIRTATGLLVFDVDRTVAGRVLLRPAGIRRGQPPANGLLRADTIAQRRALERQEEAIKTLMSDEAVSPSLKRVLAMPATAEPPELSGRPTSRELSPDKAEALNAALGTRQITLVQGPPGTGKTRLITEVVLRFLKEVPNGRVLIAAQTHIAIDHVVERLLDAGLPLGKVVRIARIDEDKVSPHVRPALLQHSVASWCQTVAARSRNQVAALGKRMGFDSGEVELLVRIEALLKSVVEGEKLAAELTLRRSDLSRAEAEALEASPSEVQKIETATVATLTVEQLMTEIQRLNDHIARLRDELRNLNENGAALADSSAAELNEWIGVWVETDPKWLEFRRQIELQIAWLDLLGQLKQFEEIVLRSASVVAGTCIGLASTDSFSRARFNLCIVDEAAKATATEALVPLVRSERALLVGDPKQLPPFRYDIELDGYGEAEINETLMDYLAPKLPVRCVHLLTHQHRMCKAIGDLIGAAFYDGALSNERPDSARPAWLVKAFPRPVVWLNTSGHHESVQGNSYVNKWEQDVVIQQLALLQKAAAKVGARATVAVIAPYSGQANSLDRKIVRDSFPSLDIEVATVDSFQGREADICVFTATRSNARENFGFLRSLQRLNVALSRPRDLLLLVGDQDFCYRVPGVNPFSTVIDFIDSHQTTCETRNAC